MAIYHMHSEVISRSGGRSILAAAAYRAAEKLHDARLGQSFDYSRKAGVVHSEIMTPEGAPAWIQNRKSLWNGADAAEKRKDSQMAREVRVALPVELSQEQQLDVLRDFIKTQFVDRGMVADFSLHHDNLENPHAHILLTTRSIEGDGFGKKCRAWNDKALYGQWRVEWANACNLGLQRAGHQIRIDHRSYAEQGIALEPTVNVGKDRPRAEADTNGYVTQERLQEYDRIVRSNGEAIIADPAIALDAITKQRATFTRSDVGRWLHTRTLGAEQFNQALSAVMNHESVVLLGVRDAFLNERFTTEEMLAVERGMLDDAQYLGAASAHSVDPRLVEQAEAGRGLSEEQRTALRHVTGDQAIAVVEGYAGTGKSRMLEGAREVWEAQGYVVQGAALAGKAAEGLEQAAGIQSRTLASLEQAWDKGYDRLSRKSVLVIDEAGMIGTRQMARVLRHVREAGAKVVLVGDTQQLQAIDAGAPMRAVGETVGRASLEDIRRQGIDWQREASMHFARGEVAQGLKAYLDHKCVVGAATQKDAIEAMVQAWAKDRQAQPGGSQVMMAFRREEVTQANQAARTVLQKGGELGPSETVQTSQGAREFAAGDRLYFLKNDRDLGVKNGSLGTVERLKDGQMTVRLDGSGERRVSFDAAAYGAIDHGYAATVHKAQGLTVKRAYVLGSDLYDRNVINVAMTRHTDSARLYVSKEAFPTFDAAVKTFAKERPKDLAVDYDEVAREADRLRREAAARQEVTRQEREQRRATERLGAGAALRAGDEGRADARSLEPDPAQERVARDARIKAFGELESRYRTAQRWARSGLLTEQQAWEGRHDVKSAQEAVRWNQDRLQGLVRMGEEFKKAHPFKAAFGVEPKLWSGGVSQPLGEVIGEVRKDLQAAEGRLGKLGRSREVLVEVQNDVATHNGKVRSAQRQLPGLAHAYENALPQQKLDRATVAKEWEQQRQLERSRDRGRGMGR
jgi:Ti-type conjugative transfer relaxase TraA